MSFEEPRPPSVPTLAETDRQSLVSARSCRGSRNTPRSLKPAGRGLFRGLRHGCQTFHTAGRSIRLRLAKSAPGGHLRSVRPGPSGSQAVAMSDRSNGGGPDDHSFARSECRAAAGGRHRPADGGRQCRRHRAGGGRLEESATCPCYLCWYHGCHGIALAVRGLRHPIARDRWTATRRRHPTTVGMLENVANCTGHLPKLR